MLTRSIARILREILYNLHKIQIHNNRNMLTYKHVQLAVIKVFPTRFISQQALSEARACIELANNGIRGSLKSAMELWEAVHPDYKTKENESFLEPDTWWDEKGDVEIKGLFFLSSLLFSIYFNVKLLEKRSVERKIAFKHNILMFRFRWLDTY